MNNKILSKLKNLKSNYNLQGIKAEYEAEGSSHNDILILRNITSVAKTKLFVKIGGVEAKNDILNCLEAQVDGIIAPMVETEFAAFKFFSFFKKKLKKIPHLSINIETKTGVQNIKYILKVSEGLLDNITIGRTDLSHSYFNEKITPNSFFIEKNIEKIITIVNKKVNITVGGSVNYQTVDIFKKNIFLRKNISKIETRKVILPTLGMLKKNALKDSLEFEKLYILLKNENLNFRNMDDLSRLTLLSTRK